MSDLKKQNSALKDQLDSLKQKLDTIAKGSNFSSTRPQGDSIMDDNKVDDSFLTFVVVGGSGDLAKKKTYPSLFALYCLGLLPHNFAIIGYARTPMSNEEFRKKAGENFKGWEDKKATFLANCSYVHGEYGSADDFGKLDEVALKGINGKKDNRVFYLAIPPQLFVEVSAAVKVAASSKNGWTRVIVEKPFGKDLESSNVLSAQLSQILDENQIFRIDHYLGKEMVQNLITLRFANAVFEPLWNRQYIDNIQIVFKEDFGTEGRGGYFDSYGIMRDVMQNHLFQILTLVAMEAPVSLHAEDIRDEKVKVGKACIPVKKEDMVVGQYLGDKSKNIPGYLEDPGVKKGSLTPTFAAAVVFVNNSRWKGVPFILKCGKGLNERKAEIRIQFKETSNPLFPESVAPRNELVIRVQPNEAVYMKFNNKQPGLTSSLNQTELDLTYKQRFDARLPDAYERLIYDVIRGDHGLFVRVDELEAAWKVFTPILHTLEKEKIKPIPYAYGSRGPVEADLLVNKYGYKRGLSYVWEQKK